MNIPMNAADLNIGKRKKWSVMVYMAGGNNLSDEARDSLMQMKEVGSTDQVHVIAQFDSGSEGKTTKRYYLSQLEEATRVNEMLKSLDANRALRNAFKKLFNETGPGKNPEVLLQPQSLANLNQLQVLPDEFPDLVKTLVVDDKNHTLQWYVENVFAAEERKTILRDKLQKHLRKLIDDPDYLRTIIVDSVLEKDMPTTILADLGDTFTGDPNELRKFIEWGVSNYPAERKMVIIWGHGDGLSVAWDAPQPPPINRQPSQCQLRYPKEYKKQKTQLTTVELKKVFDGMDIDILGFDSCTMGTLEVYYQLNGTVGIGIASEGYTPTTSWPYDKILGALQDNPAPGTLANTIVDVYGDHYKEFERKTSRGIDLSACVLSESQNVVKSLEKLLKLLLKKLKEDRDRRVINAIIAAQFRTQSYNGDDYADLYDFCQLLRDYCLQHNDIQVASELVMNAVRDEKNKKGMVSNCVHRGRPVRFSRGLSIYFPLNSIMRKYANLDFLDKRKTSYKQFLTTYLRLSRRSGRALVPSISASRARPTPVQDGGLKRRSRVPEPPRIAPPS